MTTFADAQALALMQAQRDEYAAGRDAALSLAQELTSAGVAVTAQRDALAAALRESVRHIDQLAHTVNTLSNKLGLGNKVRAADYSEAGRAALASLEVK